MEKNQLIEKIVAAEKIITKSDSIIRVVSHYDPDGICSAAIIAKAFHRLGIKFHITIVRDLNDAVIESIEKEKNKLIIFCDMGSGQIEMVERLNSGVVIFDHHPPIRDTKKVMQINPYFYGINGTYEATASMLTFLLAICIDDKNWDLIGLAVCGAIGDRQHIGGFKGLNKEYLDKGIEKGYLTEKEGLGLTGLTIKEALRDSVEPCFKEFFAKEKEVENFLKKIKLDGDTAMSELKGEKLTSLVSILLLKLIEQNVPNLIAEEIYKKKYYLVKNGIEAEEFVKIVDGCCRMDREELGFEFCLSSQESMNEAMRIRKEYRENIRREIKRLISEGAKEMENIQYFYTAKPSFGGNLTSICMNYIFNKKKPTLCLSQVGNNLKISARGTKELVLMGLNLSDGCRVAASEAKGYGGGHPVAAGATIPFEMEKKFLDTLNKIVGKQIGKNEEI